MAVDAEEREGDEADDRSLQRDLDEAREQLAATSEVLTALGRSASDLDAMLGTIVESARRLCRSDVAQLFRVDDQVYRLARSVGLSDEYVQHILGNPLRIDQSSLIGRVGLQQRTQQMFEPVDLIDLVGKATDVRVPERSEGS